MKGGDRNTQSAPLNKTISTSTPEMFGATVTFNA